MPKRQSGNRKGKQSNFAKLSIFQPNKYKFKKSCPLSVKGAPKIDYKNVRLLKKYVSGVTQDIELLINDPTPTTIIYNNPWENRTTVHGKPWENHRNPPPPGKIRPVRNSRFAMAVRQSYCIRFGDADSHVA